MVASIVRSSSLLPEPVVPPTSAWGPSATRSSVRIPPPANRPSGTAIPGDREPFQALAIASPRRGEPTSPSETSLGSDVADVVVPGIRAAIRRAATSIAVVLWVSGSKGRAGELSTWRVERPAPSIRTTALMLSGRPTVSPASQSTGPPVHGACSEPTRWKVSSFRLAPERRCGSQKAHCQSFAGTISSNSSWSGGVSIAS